MYNWIEPASLGEGKLPLADLAGKEDIEDAGWLSGLVDGVENHDGG